MAKERKTEAVHVGISYGSAVQAKKEILKTEADLLSIIKHMRNYSALRRKEFIIKNKIKKAWASVKENVLKIQAELPKLEQVEKEAGEEIKSKKQHRLPEIVNITPEDLIEMQKRGLEQEKQRTQKISHYSDIESELEDIKAQLDRLG